MKIISMANQKGGVGKSTAAFALAAGLVKQGYSVMCVDFDPQGNLSHTMCADAKHPTAFDAIIEESATLKQAIQKTPSGVDLVAAAAGLSLADTRLNLPGREYRLKEKLDELPDSEINYDFVIIDTPPELGILTVNALTASQYLIIPAQADIYSLQGIGQLYATVEAIKKHCNKDLIVLGILLTRHNNRAVLSRDMADMIQQTAENLGTSVFNAAIRETVVIKESQASRLSVYDYNDKSNAAQDCTQFTQEFLRRDAAYNTLQRDAGHNTRG